MRTVAVALLALAALSVAPAGAGEDPRLPILPVGEELAPNPGLEEGNGDRPAGWGLFRPAGAMRVEWGDFGIAGSKGLRFTGLKEGKPKRAGLSHAMAEPEAGRTITVTAWVRLTGFSGELIVWARCDGAKGPRRHAGAFENSVLAGYRPSGTTIWSPVTVRVTPDEETTRVMFGVLVAGTGRVEIDEIHATVRPVPKTPARSATGPGLYRVEGRYYAWATTAVPKLRVHIPVPILWRDQIPIDFGVRTEPAGHAKVAKLIRTKQGFHIAEVVIADIPKGKSLKFFWEGHVLVLPHAPSPVPKGVTLPVAKVPEEIAKWLDPTWCCDTKDPAIRKVADEIAAAGKTADVVVPRTLMRMKEIFRGAKGHVSALTASQALTKRGSCTSCANLGAALLRANGIPARIIAGYPTWSGPLQTHYVVEYWLPQGGWRLMESTLCRDDRPGWEQIEVAMVLPNDEEEKWAGRRCGAAGGVPYRSLTEYPDAKGLSVPAYLVGDMPGKPGCDHRAVTVKVYPADDEGWARAERSLGARWRKRTDAAVKDSGTIGDLAPKKTAASAKSLTELMRGLNER